MQRMYAYDIICFYLLYYIYFYPIPQAHNGLTPTTSLQIQNNPNVDENAPEKFASLSKMLSFSTSIVGSNLNHDSTYSGRNKFHLFT
jgi:hypothetical protein